MSSSPISTPKGGGAVGGLGEKFSPDLFTGTGNFSVPIALPAGRNGFQPELGLQYSTGSGNGIFGLGWNLSVPGVMRKTAKGVPQYDNLKDTFVLSGAEDLILISEQKVEELPDVLQGEAGIVYQYKPRTEGLYARIYHYVTDKRNCWKVMSKNGLVSWYGSKYSSTNDLSLLTAPDNASKIFGWKLSLTEDLFGSHIIYSYEQEAIREDSYHFWSQNYLKEVLYTDYEHNGTTRYMFRVAFTYEERVDAFSDYKAGFEVRTNKRCKEINIYTNPTSGELLTRTYNFQYSHEVLPAEQLPYNDISLLCHVDVVGHDTANDLTEKLPPLEFTYTYFKPKQQKFKKLDSNFLPLASLANPCYEMIDLFGNGLPDIVEINGQVRYWRNLGDGKFDIPRLMKDAPSGFNLGDPDVQLVDANGDGRTDLLVNGTNMAGYFSTKYGASWDTKAFKKYKYAPSFSFADPEVMMIDLTGDGITDALRNSSAFECFFHDKDNGWVETKRVPKKQISTFPDVSFADPRVKLADMTGDGLQDIVLVQSGSITYWPNLGYGNFAKPVTMKGSPRFQYPFDPARLQIADIDGDGQADLVYIDSNKVTFWINQSGNGWSEPFEITGTPFVTNLQGIRIVDLLGNGTAGVLYSFDAAANTQQHRWYFLDLTGSIKPYLLHEMNNNMGALTRVGYLPSTRYYLADQFGGNAFDADSARIFKNRKPWKTTLPFPVQVVSRVEVIDKLSKGKLTTEYLYHHGYWDGGEREFRGFGRVDQRDTEDFERYILNGLHGNEEFNAVEFEKYAAPVETRNWFHLGPVGDEFGDWMEVDFSDEYWQEDPNVLKQDLDTFSLLQKLPRRAKRDAYRAWRGSSLRSELYALDTKDTSSTSLTLRPYTVSESSYGIRLDAAPAGSPLLTSNIAVALTVPKETSGYIFFSFATGSRTTQWERGNDPMTQLSFTTDFDKYGQPRKQLSAALSRGMRFTIEDGNVVAPKSTIVPAEDGGGPMLCTASVSNYAQRDDADKYMVDRTCRAIAYEVKPLNNEDVFSLRDRVFTADLPVQTGNILYPVLGLSINYYDAPELPGHTYAPFNNGLPYGQLGEFGALVRTETLVLTDDNLKDAYGLGTEPVFFKSGTIDEADITGAGYPQAFYDNMQNADKRLGYIRYDNSNDANYATGWYAQSGRTKYDWQDVSISKPRGMVLETKDIFNAWASIEYDEYQLLPVKATQYLYPYGGSGNSLETIAVYDYRIMQAKMITDPNGNRAVFDFSPLGLMKQSGVIGKYGENEGDIINETPLEYKPSIRMEYDFFAYKNHGQPVWVKTIQQEKHYQDDVDSAKIMKVEYTDGFGRSLQIRGQAEDIVFGSNIFGDSGLSIDQSDINGPAVGIERSVGESMNVIVSGWKAYNNKGKIVEQYEPYFSKGFEYQETDSAKGKKIVTYYDARGNVVRTVNADNSEQWVLYGEPISLDGIALNYMGIPALWQTTPQLSEGKIEAAGSPWVTYVYDVNDLAYVTHGLNQKDIFTPTSSIIDSLGRTIKTTNHVSNAISNELLPDQNISEVVIKFYFDIRGNLLSVQDAKNRKSFAYSYDLRPKEKDSEEKNPSLKPIKTMHIDKGVSTTLFDAAGNVIETADQKGGHVLFAYDNLNRQKFLWAKDNADQTSFTLRRIYKYGDSAELINPANKNLIGRLYSQYDEAGFEIFEEYNFKGNLISKSRQFIIDSELTINNKYVVDWTAEPDILEIKSYRSKFVFDALNRPIKTIFPSDIEEKNKVLLAQYNQAGALEKVTLQDDENNGDIFNEFVKHIAYNAKGQRILIAYDNGIMTRYAYDNSSGRIARLQSSAYQILESHKYSPNGNIIQDYSYVHDLIGNIVSINHNESDCGVVSGVDTLNRKFNYDALYRLIAATGRECYTHPSIPWEDRMQGDDSNYRRMYTEQYGYDELGNLMKLKHIADGNSFTRYYNGVITDPNYNYAANNYLDKVSVGSNIYTFKYNSTGDLVKQNSDRYYEWSYNDQLSFFKIDDGSTVTIAEHYLYGASGKRLKKYTRNQQGEIDVIVYIDGMFEHRYKLDPFLEVVEENNEININDDVHLICKLRIGNAFYGDATPTLKYILDDHISSSCVRLTGSGSIIDKQEYYPFGETSLRTYTRKRYQYCGKERDEHSGLFCYGARYYCNWCCRFISGDKLCNVLPNMSFYHYAANNPIVFTDIGGYLPGGGGGTPTIARPTARPVSYPRELTRNLDPGGRQQQGVPVNLPEIETAPSRSGLPPQGYWTYDNNGHTYYQKGDADLWFDNSWYEENKKNVEANEKLSPEARRKILEELNNKIESAKLAKLYPSPEQKIITKLSKATYELNQKNNGSNYLYRFDTRAPEEIAAAGGFKAWGTNMDLRQHATGVSVKNKTSGFISTSRSMTTVMDELWKGRRDGYIYVIKEQPTGRDVNAELGANSPFPAQQEVAVPNNIPVSDIVFAIPLKAQ